MEDAARAAPAPGQKEETPDGTKWFRGAAMDRHCHG
jgi:hypothetical protein